LAIVAVPRASRRLEFGRKAGENRPGRILHCEGASMVENGAVSLWVGDSSSWEDLASYMRVTYSNDGEAVPSPFASDFDICSYDEDFLEANCYETPSRLLRELLKLVSYDDVVIPKFVALCGEQLPEPVNSIVLLYNFRHDGPVRVNSRDSVRLRYIGTVEAHLI
jgi:hypothetical protein